ncbi:hypothetical protein C1H46_040492 [Malus baccata]|uniref:TOG domain-containing protein n=1 Tax=Malus baccata TaxID=106549 RepID=A0A540KIB9_MALBA|nr:hypothetical protein C1H46_040492 [Malus baccata]
MPVLMNTLIASLASSSSERRQVAGRSLGELVRKLGERVLPWIIPILSQGLKDSDVGKRQGVCIGLSEVMAGAGKNQLLSFMDELIPTIRTALLDSMPECQDFCCFAPHLTQAGPAATYGGTIVIPGFCLPKALQPLLPIFHQGLTSGSAELREQAALGLGELIEVTSEQALKEFVVPITGYIQLTLFGFNDLGQYCNVTETDICGMLTFHKSDWLLLDCNCMPLIQIIGDRFPWQVKSAILSTLTIMIRKGGMALKPFLPQLQTTFVKCLQDSTRIIHSSAALALGKLSALSTRVDPLVGDVLSSLQHAWKSVSSAVRTRLYLQLKDLIHHEDDQVRISAASILGITSQYLEDDQLTVLLQELSDFPPSLSLSARHGYVLTISSMLRHNPSTICLSPEFPSILDRLKGALIDEKFPLRETSTKAFGRLMIHKLRSDPSNTSLHLEIISSLVSALRNDSSEVRRKALSAIKRVSKENASVILARINIIVPALAECLKDGSTPARLAAERCALHAFQLSKGPENVQAAQKFITGLDARGMSKLPENSDDSEDGEDTVSG